MEDNESGILRSLPYATAADADLDGLDANRIFVYILFITFRVNATSN